VEPALFRRVARRATEPISKQRELSAADLTIEEFLEPLGMSQAAFAQKIGWTKARLNELIRGKRGVTAEAALDLAEILGTSPKIWMNFQATYDLDRAKRARRRSFQDSPAASERLVIRLGVAESPSADAPGGWALTLLLQRPAWIANGDNWWVFDRPMPAWTTST